MFEQLDLTMIIVLSFVIVIGGLIGFLLSRFYYHASLVQLKSEFSESQHGSALEISQLGVKLTAQRDQEQRLEQSLSEMRSELAKEQGLFQNATRSQHQVEKQFESIRSTAKGLQVQNTELRDRLTSLEQVRVQERDTHSVEVRVLQEKYTEMSNAHTELKTTLERKTEHFHEQMQHLSETKKALTQEFENLANKIFEEKGKTFANTSQSNIDQLLKPFREQIEGFQKRVNDVHDASVHGNSALAAEIKKVLDVGLQMSSEANNLTSALKGDSQQRGAWGEAQLCRTLEMSGLLQDAHYEAQTSFKDSEGKHKQTDYLIKLPDGKHMIIDSKVSLNAYDRAISAQNQDESRLAMEDHIKSVRRHIDDLHSKDYTNLVGMRSPSFVLMFMPIEPAYIEALKNQKDLFEYGYSKGIVLVSHTTLIPILRTVSNLWMMENSTIQAREISEKAGELYNQVCVVADRLTKLGHTLNTASTHYNGAVTALAGQQGLYGKVERFKQLSVKVSKNLPKLETTHMDFEAQRMALIVEPIDEADDCNEGLALEGNIGLDVGAHTGNDNKTELDQELSYSKQPQENDT